MKYPDEHVITKFIENCHKSGESKVGHMIAKRFLEDNKMHWKDAGVEFLYHFGICCFDSQDASTTLDITSHLLAYRDLSDSDRKRVEEQRQKCILLTKDKYLIYPESIAKQINNHQSHELAQTTFLIIKSNHFDDFTKTLNSFLHCCRDLLLISNWICIDMRPDTNDQRAITERYPFFSIIDGQAGRVQTINIFLKDLQSSYFFYCETGWQFSVQGHFIKQAMEILDFDEKLGQVLVNRNYLEYTSHQFPFTKKKQTSDGLWYAEQVYINSESESPDPPQISGIPFDWPHFILQPSMLRKNALQKTGQLEEETPEVELIYAKRFTANGFKTAFLSTNHCLKEDRLSSALIKKNEIFRNFSSKQNETNIVRIKPLAWWCTSKELCEILNKQSQGNYSWNRLELTWEDDADLFTIFQSPRADELFIPERTIVFQTEALATENPGTWGATWSNPNPNDFFHVRLHKDFPNCVDWHIGLSYVDLLSDNTPDKSKLISAIVSGNYFAPGHKKRVDFLKSYEKHPQAIPIDIFGLENPHGLLNYLGPLPLRNKAAGLLPYRYTFNAENNLTHNYFSEKIIDAILAETLCFYWGCPNLEDWIDRDAFIRLDLEDINGSIEVIRSAIMNDEWSKRLPILREMKKKILNELHFFPIVESFLKEGMTPAYIINLDRRTDRWEQVQKNLHPHWKNYKRFSAVDRQTLHLSPSQHKLFRDNVFLKRKGVIACALSHLALWQKLEGDPIHSHYLILEDDIEFCEQFGDRLRDVVNIIPNYDWDIIFLGVHVWRDQRISRMYDREAKIVYLSMQAPAGMIGGTFAYLISKPGAIRLTQIAEEYGIQTAIDAWIMLQFDKIKVFFAEPNLVYSEYVYNDGIGNQVDSDIQYDYSE